MERREGRISNETKAPANKRRAEYQRTLLEVLHISGRQGNADLVLSNLGGLLESSLGGLSNGGHVSLKYGQIA